MEKLMYRVAVCCLVVGMFFVGGCEDEKTHCSECGDGWPRVRSLQIVMGDSTLEFLPGDSVSTSVVVIARDGNGLVVSDERIVVTLENPLLGLLEFVDPVRRDTTNAQGQVLLVFRSYGQFGANEIIAMAGGVVASLPFTVREGGTPLENIWISVSPDYLCAYDDAHPADTVSIRVVFTQPGGLPVPNFGPLIFTVDAGYLSSDTMRTDSNGVAESGWILSEPPGTYHIWVTYDGGSAQDSIQVRRCSSISLNPSTIYTGKPPCDSTEILGLVFGHDGFPIPNINPNVRVSYGHIGVIFPTDSVGVIHAWWFLDCAPAGEYCISIGLGGELASACVAVKEK